MIEKNISRPTEGKMIAGVCAAIGNYFKIDPTFVRIGAVVISLMSAGTAAVLYLVGWAVIPETGSTKPLLNDMINWVKSQTSKTNPNNSNDLR